MINIEKKLSGFLACLKRPQNHLRDFEPRPSSRFHFFKLVFTPFKTETALTRYEVTRKEAQKD